MSEHRYSLAAHGTGIQREASPNKVLRPDVRNLYYYGLNYGDNGQNIIRIWPNYSLDDNGNKVWTPFRNSLDIPMDFGDWIRRYPVARKVAGTHLTFIIGDPSREYDFSHKPINVLHDALTRAIKAGQEKQGWSRLLDRDKSGAMLQKSSFCYFVQCGLFSHGTRGTYKDGKGFPGVHPEMYGVLMELTEAAGREMLQQMDMRKEVSGDTPLDDFEARFVHGDPISLTHGRFVTFYKKSDMDPRQRRAYNANGASINTLGLVNTLAGSGNQQAKSGGYNCFIEATCEAHPMGTISAVMPADLHASIENKVKPWDEILYFPSEVEQAHMIAPLYPADLIMYAFADHPDWIPDGVRAASVNAVSFAAPRGAMPGFSPAASVAPPASQLAATPLTQMTAVPQIAQPVVAQNVDKPMQQLAAPNPGFGTLHVQQAPGSVTPMPGVAQPTAIPTAVPPAAPPPGEAGNKPADGLDASIAAASNALAMLRANQGKG